MYISPDMCPADRQENYRIRQKIKLLRVNHPGRRVYIKNNKLYSDDNIVDEVNPLKDITSN